MFFNKIFLMLTKQIIYMTDFLCQIEILLLNMLKLLKIRGFYSFLKFKVF